MDTENRNALQQAIDELGPYKVAKLCRLKGPSIYKWRAAGRLPRTEWTGETNYAEAISGALNGKFSRADLLQLPAAANPTPTDQVSA